jgi:hypothetical protein
MTRPYIMRLNIKLIILCDECVDFMHSFLLLIPPDKKIELSMQFYIVKSKEIIRKFGSRLRDYLFGIGKVRVDDLRGFLRGILLIKIDGE